MELLNRKVFFLLKEYEKLKDEQGKRIEYRDHMTYITLGAIGAVFSFVIEKPDYSVALLVLPFVCIVLGWTYLTNDEKVSQIGTYIRTKLIPKIEGENPDGTFSLQPNWEHYHSESDNRSQNKIIQLLLDLLLFCISAIFSLATFIYLVKCVYPIQIIIMSIEVLLVAFLAYKFIAFLLKSKNDV